MKPPLALKDGKPFRLVDRETKKCLLGMKKDFSPKVVLDEIPQRKPEPIIGAPVAAPVVLSRQQKRAFARKHVARYMQKHDGDYRHLNAKQRKHFERELLAKVLKEAPKEAFERHTIKRSELIVPEVQIQAEGLPAPANEQRSPGGIILP